MLYLELFWAFFQIGIFSVGGGMASMPLLQYQLIEVNQWLTMTEFTDLVTIAQMTPGPIAVNSATFVGIKIAGVSGMLVATIGCLLPSCFILFGLSWAYKRFRNLIVIQGVLNGLRSAVVALIGSAAIMLFTTAIFKSGALSLNVSDVDMISVILFIGAMIALRKTKIDPILIMLGSGVIGAVLYLVVEYAGNII